MTVFTLVDLPGKKFLMKPRLYLLLPFAFSFVGCGGGEDFSQPPANLAEVRAKSKGKQPAESGGGGDVVAKVDKQDAGANDEASTSRQNAAAGAAPRTSEEPAAEESTSALVQADAVSSEKSDSTPDSSGKSAGSATPDDKAAAVAETKTPDSGVMTAGGKTEDELKAAQDGKQSVASAGMSLLDKLNSDNADSSKAEGVGKSGAAVARQAISRTGRFAVAVRTWFELRNQLAKRFYVAATANGARIAASSGQRSLGVLSTQIAVLGQELSWTSRGDTVAAVVRDRKEITTQPVTGFPAVLTALELIQNGDLVLVGTNDGRLIARSCANLQDWDVYAQDLFSLQDEHRPATRLSDSPIRVVRAIGEGSLLTIDDVGSCCIWKTSDVVHSPVGAMEMTEEQVQSPEAPVLDASPVCAVSLPNSRVLSVVVSSSGKLAAVVTSDEQLTIFKTDDGAVVSTITAVELDDTQPVCCLIEEQQGRVLVGLADGRVIRRALPGGDSVTGTNDSGETVEFEVVFAPELNDRFGAVCCMNTNADSTVLYLGRATGFVGQFDLPRKQMLRMDKLHEGPIVEIRSNESGLFTVGDERIAKLSNVPGAARPGVVAETFRLPTDEALRDTHLIEPDESLKQDKFTVRRNFDGDVTDASAKQLVRAAIRPADPVQALYEHQLRVAVDDESREMVRERILKTRESAANVSADRTYSGDSPVKLAELDTVFDFKSLPMRRVVMSLSNDGKILAASQYYQDMLIRAAAPNQPVVVWDTITGTPLRTWKSSKGVQRLDLDVESGMILPSPLSAKMNLFSGSYSVVERSVPSSDRFIPDDRLAVGMTGVTGTALPAIGVYQKGGGPPLSGIEAFEAVVPALAWSADGTSLFVSIRERTQTRLIEVDGTSLNEISEIIAEPMTGSWNVESVDMVRGTLGATRILPSPTGKLLLTYGKYANPTAPYQLRIWKRSGSKWSKDDVIVLDSNQSMLETEMTDTQMVFVNGQDAQVAIVGANGVGVVNARTGDIDQKLDLPKIAGRQPVTALSPDGKWLFAGDLEGTVWVWSLRSLNRKPLQFSAQAGPISGLALSADAQVLATAGEENRIRVWKIGEFLGANVKSASR